MKLVGKVTNQESGYEIGQLRVLVCDANSQILAQTDTRIDGCFECELSQSTEHHHSVLVCPPNTTDPKHPIAMERVDLTHDETFIPLCQRD